MNRPDWLDNDYPSYETIVDSWEYEVLAFETTGSYQGDHEVLLLDSGGRYGFLMIGYGSCSGCDLLEAIIPHSYTETQDWTEVDTFRNDLTGEIQWFDTAEDALTFLRSKIQGDVNSWYSWDREINEVLEKFIELIQGRMEVNL